MAYLNVRERRIEAKIAYVGPTLAGKTTNIEQLREAVRLRTGRVDPPDAGKLAVAWRPSAGTAFRDCDVVANVVVYRGVESDGRLTDVLADADGVVLVVDAHPSAQAENRASFSAIGEALGRAERRSVPVVIQVNKADLEDALGAEAVVSGLGATGLPLVSATASRGLGVVETLERTLEAVLASMQKEVEPPASPRGEAASDAGAPGQSPSDGGHPLLSALRQLLRDTVREHVAELEARLFARLDGSMARVSERLAANEAARVELQKTLSDIAEVVMDASHRTDALTDRAHATLEAVRDVAPSLDTVSLSLNRSAARVEDALRALRAELLDGVVRQDPDVHARLTDLLRELRSWKRGALD